VERYDGMLTGLRFAQGSATAENVNVHLATYSGHPSCSGTRTFDSSRASRNGIRAPWLIGVFTMTAAVQLPFNIEVSDDETEAI
jgi:hypothetical protein